MGGVSTARHPDTDALTVFVYDGHPGGAGFAERGYAAAGDGCPPLATPSRRASASRAARRASSPRSAAIRTTPSTRRAPWTC
ncbi:MAG: DUF1998 domain-containing protein [Nocardioides sp.]